MKSIARWFRERRRIRAAAGGACIGTRGIAREFMSEGDAKATFKRLCDVYDVESYSIFELNGMWHLRMTVLADYEKAGAQ